jgi:hypothetical protein
MTELPPLPPLPPPDLGSIGFGRDVLYLGYSDEQMLAFGKACAAAEREACADIVENHNPGGSYHIRTALAAAIRARKP